MKEVTIKSVKKKFHINRCGGDGGGVIILKYEVMKYRVIVFVEISCENYHITLCVRKTFFLCILRAVCKIWRKWRMNFLLLIHVRSKTVINCFSQNRHKKYFIPCSCASAKMIEISSKNELFINHTHTIFI